MLVSKNADKNYIEDTETTPKSCLDVVFELLATTAGTSSSNSSPESVRLLESQLQVERHRWDVMRQEAEGLRKSLQNSDAYFLVQQQALEDLSAKQRKLISLLSILPALWVPRIFFLELFWSSFSSGLVLLRRLFALVANFDNQCIWYAALFPIFALVVNFDAQWM